MNSAMERLLGLRVQDVMNQEVAQLSPQDPMTSAARTLAVEMISGAPVVGSDGHCVGVLTASDFVRRSAASEPNGGKPGALSSTDNSKHLSEPENVDAWMSAKVESIRPTASILTAARQMCAAHIHRLIVVDEDKPVGVITTLDLVSAMILAFEE